MSSLAELPVELFLDNVLPFTQVSDILRLGCTSKVLIFPPQSYRKASADRTASFLHSFVPTKPFGGESLRPISTFRVMGQLAPQDGNSSIVASSDPAVNFESSTNSTEYSISATV